MARRDYALYMPGPTIGRLSFGLRLKELRNAAGVTPLDAARAVGDRSDLRVRHWEAGRRLPRLPELKVLGRLYGLDETAIEQLWRQCGEANTRNRWTRFGLSDSGVTFLGLEEDATEVRCVEHLVIPGLLQTERYMRSLFILAGLDKAAADKRVRARLQRQERLADGDPLRLFAVISEAALRLCVHEPGVGAAQLQHLSDRAQWPNVDLRVLPFATGLHAGVDGPFTLLRFPPGALGDVVYEEHVSGGHLVIDEVNLVTRLDTLFDELRGQALDEVKSLAFLAQLTE